MDIQVHHFYLLALHLCKFISCVYGESICKTWKASSSAPQGFVLSTLLVSPLYQ